MLGFVTCWHTMGGLNEILSHAMAVYVYTGERPRRPERQRALETNLTHAFMIQPRYVYMPRLQANSLMIASLCLIYPPRRLSPKA